MAIVYIWRIVEVACFAPVEKDGEAAVSIPPALFVVTWIVAIANIYFGLAPALPFSLSATAADILLGHAQ